MSASQPTIRSVGIKELNIPLWESFGISGGVQQTAKNVLVTVELADGTRGYGEAAPLPPFNGETQEMARDAIEAAKGVLVGADVRQWRWLAGEIRPFVKGVGSAQCAIETAMLDALTRQAKMPMWAFFGGASTRIETDMTLPIPSLPTEVEAVEHAVNFTRTIAASGIGTIKIKVGGNAVSDVSRIEAVCATAPDARLILDGNAGYETVEEALYLLELLSEKNIVPVLFEQPIAKDDLAGLRRVTQGTDVPIAADESAYSVDSVRRIIEQKAANVVNVKLMKFGIVEALDIVALCRAHNIGVDDRWHGRIAFSDDDVSVFCRRYRADSTMWISDTPFFMESIPLRGSCYDESGLLEDGRIKAGARLNLGSIGAGHGVSPCIYG